MAGTIGIIAIQKPIQLQETMLKWQKDWEHTQNEWTNRMKSFLPLNEA
jgi:hypothetical protein